MVSPESAEGAGQASRGQDRFLPASSAYRSGFATDPRHREDRQEPPNKRIGKRG